ncbi:hypothetical protein GW17_00029471 [Ensete ventricosum]|nr:hypothetical protein GW17_00029471 [Ensete ventricosum]
MSIGESPYSLAFGTEVVLPPEVVFPTLRVKHFEPEASEVGLKENLDLVKELRAEAHLHALSYWNAIAQLYNCRVRPRPIGDDDLVLRKAKVSDPGHTRSKLAPKWKGLYCVICTIRDDTYVLATMDDRVLPRMWHISNLKKFYV